MCRSIFCEDKQQVLEADRDGYYVQCIVSGRGNNTEEYFRWSLEEKEEGGFSANSAVWIAWIVTFVMWLLMLLGVTRLYKRWHRTLKRFLFNRQVQPLQMPGYNGALKKSHISSRRSSNRSESIGEMLHKSNKSNRWARILKIKNVTLKGWYCLVIGKLLIIIGFFVKVQILLVDLINSTNGGTRGRTVQFPKIEFASNLLNVDLGILLVHFGVFTVLRHWAMMLQLLMSKISVRRLRGITKVYVLLRTTFLAMVLVQVVRFPVQILAYSTGDEVHNVRYDMFRYLFACPLLFVSYAGCIHSLSSKSLKRKLEPLSSKKALWERVELTLSNVRAILRFYYFYMAIILPLCMLGHGGNMASSCFSYFVVFNVRALVHFYLALYLIRWFYIQRAVLKANSSQRVKRRSFRRGSSLANVNQRNESSFVKIKDHNTEGASTLFSFASPDEFTMTGSDGSSGTTNTTKRRSSMESFKGENGPGVLLPPCTNFDK